MRIDILTLFPEGFSYLDTSILKRAKQEGKLQINIIDIREFSTNKHKKCDDYPFGGGAGMLMAVQPLYDCIKSVQKEGTKLIFPSPSGKIFDFNLLQEYAKEEHLVFICGHYEGIDQRILDIFKPDEVTIGDYVLTGGELPAMVMIDAIARYVDGVISRESLQEESFSNGLLEYPQYTRPADFMGYKVPDVLLSGNHGEVAKWRRQKSEEKTRCVRPDILKKGE